MICPTTSWLKYNKVSRFRWGVLVPTCGLQVVPWRQRFTSSLLECGLGAYRVNRALLCSLSKKSDTANESSRDHGAYRESRVCCIRPRFSLIPPCLVLLFLNQYRQRVVPRHGLRCRRSLDFYFSTCEPHVYFYIFTLPLFPSGARKPPLVEIYTILLPDRKEVPIA